jgi:hypothetical protein
MKTRIIIIISLITCILFGNLLSIAQPVQGPRWYFGQNAGLDFTLLTYPAGLPTGVTGPIKTFEGCAVIYDDTGVRFSTDGSIVYNKNNVQMPNGYGLKGNSSATQSAIIVPKPATSETTCDTFYIFTVDAVENKLANGMCYSKVSMSANGGLGDVVVKNVYLDGPVTEKLTAISDGGAGFWVIAHRWNSSEFLVYKVDGNGISAPVISSAGSVHAPDLTGNPNLGSDYYYPSQGQMKLSPVSPNGSNIFRLALAVGTTNFVEVFNFDRSSGIISSSNVIKLNAPNGTAGSHPYGVEFSPDGKLLYVTTQVHSPNTLWQFDLTANNSNLQWNNGIAIENTTGGNIWHDISALQIGPDNKIYVARDINKPVNSPPDNYLSVINRPNNIAQPNNQGNLPAFQRFGPQFQSGTSCSAGLPTMVQGDFSCAPEPGCSCCDDIDLNIQSSTVQMGGFWYVKSKLSTGPNRITEVKATMVNFYMNLQPDCERCVTQNLSFGSIIPTSNPGPNQTSQLNWNYPTAAGNWVSPSLTGCNGNYQNSNPREFVWNKIINGQFKSRPPLNNEEVYMRVIFPEVFQNQCCNDTINFCIRWTITDTTCLTCDTLICYTITQQWQGGTGGGVTPGGTVDPVGILIPNPVPMQKEGIDPSKQKEKGNNNKQDIKNEDKKGRKQGDGDWLTN